MGLFYVLISLRYHYIFRISHTKLVLVVTYYKTLICLLLISLLTCFSSYHHLAVGTYIYFIFKRTAVLLSCEQLHSPTLTSRTAITIESYKVFIRPIFSNCLIHIRNLYAIRSLLHKYSTSPSPGCSLFAYS